MMWDSGLCVAAGCMMCGWSILVENAKKRLELALFVAPRAAVTLLPRRYDKKVCFHDRDATKRKISSLNMPEFVLVTQLLFIFLLY